MNVRGFCTKTQHDYLRIVSRFTVFIGLGDYRRLGWFARHLIGTNEADMG